MKAMTEHISRPDVATSLSLLMSEEISANERDVQKYVHDWLPGDIEKIKPILASEKEYILNSDDLSKKNDSVKGESAMLGVYSAAGENKATDAITLKETGALLLVEAKYLIKLGCKGPFGGMGSFKERVAEKFNAMEKQMIPDGETIEPLRVLVVTEEQLPFSIEHIRMLAAGDYPSDAFSSDGKRHEYVLCSSSSLRMMVDNPPVGKPNAAKYFFFSI